MISPEQFITYSLSQSQVGQKIARILAAAINAVDPYILVQSAINRSENKLIIENQHYNLDKYDKIILIGVGKASLLMSDAVNNILGEYIHSGIIITKDAPSQNDHDQLDRSKLIVFEAGHPYPDVRSISATRQVLDLLTSTQSGDLIIFLISGGGSALLTLPADGITLADLQDTTKLLLASGASINEINCVRKHLDLVKGGQLARSASPATMISLILSDVISDPLDIIASGPTVPDHSTFEDALNVLDAYNLTDRVPQSIITVLQNGAQHHIAETPKLGDPIFNKTHNFIIGNIKTATQAAFDQAQDEGFSPLLLTDYLQGEAVQVGKLIGAIARQSALHNTPVNRPACIILGGESTVTLRGNGMGGRNQEVALGVVEMISGLGKTIVVTLATDGVDGPTDAAGAVVTGETLTRACALNMSVKTNLQNNNSYYYFKSLGDLIIIGPTLTNVNDLCMIVTY